MQVLFYSTPIVYPLSVVPDDVLWLYELNPLVRFIEAFRNILYDLRFPSLVTTLYLLAWSAGMVAFGLWVFSKLDRRLAEEV
jgi:ABC-type polysaccharide/polyol phosphate export permease